jgi:peptidoglycan/xylan/chitin deacetylase (PgdA/CDA1 family)
MKNPDQKQRLATLLIVLTLIFSAVARTLTSTSAQGSAPANELGRFLILEYHLIQEQETRWGRSIPNFKQDLERLYAAGYRSVAMADIIDGKIDLPAGTKPVLLTFDDSSPGQFRYLVKNGKKEIDPDCAVGLLLSFHRQHPDFAKKAVFFVLPEAKQPHKLFGQPEYEADKLKELTALGFEIGNHTLWHANLGKYDETTVQKQLAESVEAVQKRVPGYSVRSLALPFGVYPKDLQLAVKGGFKGKSYQHEAILMVAGGAAQSPFNSGCDLLHLPRIQVPGPDLKYWLAYYDKHPEEAFVSDGQPGTVTFPKALQPKFNVAKFKKLQVVPY